MTSPHEANFVGHPVGHVPKKESEARRQEGTESVASGEFQRPAASGGLLSWLLAENLRNKPRKARAAKGRTNQSETHTLGQRTWVRADFGFGAAEAAYF
jgi:hypothetical protein